MTASFYQIRQCEHPKCGLRYPAVEGQRFREKCPRCGSATRLVLRQALGGGPGNDVLPPNGQPLEALLDNIRSAWNVGSMFRTADGVGMRRVHLCGFTATPDQAKVRKTSLGAEGSLEWFQYQDGVAAAAALKEQGLRLWALERGSQADHLFDIASEVPGPAIVLVAGNEVCGVDPGILEQCEHVISLPMLGVKHSFNVAVAFGIAAYFLRFVRFTTMSSSS